MRHLPVNERRALVRACGARTLPQQLGSTDDSSWIVGHPEVGRRFADHFRLVGRVQRWRPERRPATGRETAFPESGPARRCSCSSRPPVNNRVFRFSTLMRSMRHAVGLLFILAGSGGAQGQHFDARQTGAAPSSLSREMLAAHNAVRARVKVSPLAWSDRLATVAQKWWRDGRPKPATMTTGQTSATACAGTTRRLSGAIRKRWAARRREASGARCGFANTIRLGIGLGSGRIEAG